MIFNALEAVSNQKKTKDRGSTVINTMHVILLFFFNFVWMSGSTAGSSRKPASNILKRGRTIIKKRHESTKKSVPRSNVLKVMDESDPSDAEDLKIDDSKELNLTIPHEDTESDGSIEVSHSKEPVKLNDKLISGEEVEIRPSFESKNSLPEPVDDFEKRSSLKMDDSDDKTLEASDFQRTRSNKCFKTSADYPKLYISATSALEENEIAKSSLLKNIKGIQNVGTDSYGIEISNSRFFVPKDYVYSGVENAMDDLKFEVDPEMRKVLQESTQTNNNSINIDNSEVMTGVQESPHANESKDIFSFDSKNKENSLLLQTSKFKESKEEYKNDSSSNKKPRLFLKKSESRSGSEIVDSLLDTNHKQNIFNSTLKNRIFSTSLDNLNLRTHSADNSSNSVIRKIRQKEDSNPYNDCDSRIRYRDTNDVVTARPRSFPIEPYLPCKSPDDVDLSNIKKEKDKEKEKYNSTYPILSSLENLPRSTLDTPFASFSSRVASREFPTSFSKETNRGLDCVSTQKTVNGALKFDSDSQEIGKNLTLCEANRLKRMKFLSMNLSQSEPATESETSNSAVITRRTRNESSSSISESKIGQNSSDSMFKDKLLIGRTSSLREKFETIVEDVELRPGRQIGTIIRDCKSQK